MTLTEVKIETRLCKTPGCAGFADKGTGRYAMLCTTCAATARRRLAEAAPEPTPRATPADPSGGGTKEQTKELLRIAQQIDKQRAACERLKTDYRHAATILRNREDAYRTLLHALLGETSGGAS